LAIREGDIEYYSREEALASLSDFDPAYPEPVACSVLARPESDHLLGYVSQEAFTHVFPGDSTKHPSARFFDDLSSELARSATFHLWADVPLCRYRCNFCQFPILVVSSRNGEVAAAAGRRWVDANIAEAGLWLEAVPALRATPVGEFCLFGGTPTSIPAAELGRLLDFYMDGFNFTSATSLRAEGSPDSLDRAAIASLHDMGFRTLTYGTQTFNDGLLAVANRRHSGEQAARAIAVARELGFQRVDGDLVYGLPGQTVAGFLSDVERMIGLGFSTIVIIKLHLRPFKEVDYAVGHVSPAPWELPEVRSKLAARGYDWPSLGRQYQMREMAVARLVEAGYREHPTTYFPHSSVGPERWRALNLDQDKQYPQVGIGLGAYTWSTRSEATVTSDPHLYLRQVQDGVIPLSEVSSISDAAREVRAVRMALSTCQPLREETHRERFPGASLFTGQWRRKFADLERRGLARVDAAAGTVTLTATGTTLVEAIINTEIG